MFRTDTVRILPCGGSLRLDRMRSDGILSPDELAYCRSEDIPVAYDPMQCGWVLAEVTDDLYPNEVLDRAHPRTPRARPDVALHLHMRPWQRSDAARLTRLLDDPLMWATMPEPYPDPLTRDMAASLIDIANHGDHHSVQAVLFDDLPIGQVRVLHSPARQSLGFAEISYWIGRDYWGQGFASAAVSAFVKQTLAEDRALVGLVAQVQPGNLASMRVLEKAGFMLDAHQAQSDWLVLRRTR